MENEAAFRTDEDFMRIALRQAARAAAEEEVPVGAVAVDDSGAIIGRAANQVEKLSDGTAHAEMIALTQASAAVGDWRLNAVTLYVTKEPCPMCAGAMINCRLGRLVFGCPDPHRGGAGSALNLLDFPGLPHKVDFSGGVLAEECLALIQGFFQFRRQQNK